MVWYKIGVIYKEAKKAIRYILKKEKKTKHQPNSQQSGKGQAYKT